MLLTDILKYEIIKLTEKGNALGLKNIKRIKFEAVSPCFYVFELSDLYFSVIDSFFKEKQGMGINSGSSNMNVSYENITNSKLNTDFLYQLVITLSGDALSPFYDKARRSIETKEAVKNELLSIIKKDMILNAVFDKVDVNHSRPSLSVSFYVNSFSLAKDFNGKKLPDFSFSRVNSYQPDQKINTYGKDTFHPLALAKVSPSAIIDAVIHIPTAIKNHMEEKKKLLAKDLDFIFNGNSTEIHLETPVSSFNASRGTKDELSAMLSTIMTR